MFSSNCFTSVQDKTLSYLPKVSLSFWQPKTA